MFASQLEAGDTVDDVSDDVIGAIGEKRVREGQVFVEWFDEHVWVGFDWNAVILCLARVLEGSACIMQAIVVAVDCVVWCGRRWVVDGSGCSVTLVGLLLGGVGSEGKELKEVTELNGTVRAHAHSSRER